MRKIAALIFIGAFLALPVREVSSESLGEWLIKPGGSPPLITHSYASDKLHHGDIWRIYVEASDPDGDMLRFVCVFNQAGYGSYSAAYVVVKKQHREKMKGYLNFFSAAGAGLRMPEWTQLKMTLYIQDRGGNISNKVDFPLVLSRGARQEPPPAPFDTGTLERLGTISVELVNPQEDGNGHRFPFRGLFR
jgi:hypothetical protein